MATYNATDLLSKPVWSKENGNMGIYYGTYTGTPATGDVWRLCRVPAGFKVLRTTLKNADLGTSAPADLGYNFIDGTSGDDVDAFANDQELGTAATTETLFADAPVSITRDSYIELTFGTISSGASGAVSVIVEGELFGAK